MVSFTTADARGSHCFMILFVYMRSVKVNDGVMFKYLKSENVADIGTVCCIAFFQSFIKFDLNNKSCFVVIELRNIPE